MSALASTTLWTVMAVTSVPVSAPSAAATVSAGTSMSISETEPLPRGDQSSLPYTAMPAESAPRSSISHSIPVRSSPSRE
ncbi:hypothetical protein QBA54_39095 [Streptomyces sp. B21-108]|uniref:hypothetical protein n=1 Tax=Streptomyces sp. B21-108 TaxID=3039419 RepID=UPI002FF42EE5